MANRFSISTLPFVRLQTHATVQVRAYNILLIHSLIQMSGAWKVVSLVRIQTHDISDKSLLFLPRVSPAIFNLIIFLTKFVLRTWNKVKFGSNALLDEKLKNRETNFFKKSSFWSRKILRKKKTYFSFKFPDEFCWIFKPENKFFFFENAKYIYNF